MEAELRNLLTKQVKELNFNRTKVEGVENVAIKKLYATYLDEFRNFQLNRLQPEKVWFIIVQFYRFAPLEPIF